MEKKVYELKIDPEFEQTLPAPSDAEIEGLTKQLIDEGCRDALVTWDGVIIDGHNRYRICHENNIPFAYVEKEFVSRDEAKLWIISTQLNRRNLTDFAKCELVLPLEASLKAEAKKRQGQRNDLANISVNLPKSERSKSTREQMGEIAGVSEKTFDKAKKLINSADEETKKKLYSGELSIHGAYTQMMAKEKEGRSEDVNPSAKQPQSEQPIEAFQQSPPEPHRNKLIPREVPLEPANTDVFPGYGLVVPVKPEPYERPSDDVYNIPPINVCGIIPADNLELREKVEITHVSSELRTATEYYVRRSGEIMRGLSEASINDGNIEFLKSIVTEGYETIIQFLNSIQYGGTYDECEEN